MVAPSSPNSNIFWKGLDKHASRFFHQVILIFSSWGEKCYQFLVASDAFFCCGFSAVIALGVLRHRNKRFFLLLRIKPRPCERL